MAIEVIVRNGAGVETDITDRVRLPGPDDDIGLQLGNRAYQCEAAQSTLTIDDDDGEYGNPEDLPSGLTMLSIAAHNVVTVRETATAQPTVLVRGRVIPKEIGRGATQFGRSREITLRLDDHNADVKGLAFLQQYSRPEETDVQRATWVLTTFLQGSPRTSTNLTDGIVTASPVTLPPKEFEAGTHPYEVLNDCATAADKDVFVMATGLLYYGPTTDASQVAGIRISDRDDEIDMVGISDPTALTPHPTISTPNGGFEDGDTDEWMAGIGLQAHPHPVQDYTDPNVVAALGTYYGGSGTVGVLDPYHQYHGWLGETFTAGVTYTVAFWVMSSSAYSVIKFGDLTPGTYPGVSPSGDYAEVHVVAGFHTISWTPTANRTSVLLHQHISSHGSINIDRVLLLASAPTLTFPPIPVGPAATEDGQGLLSGGVLKHADGFVTETRPSVADDYDYWVDTINDTGAVSSADAAARLSAILDVFEFEHRTYRVAVLLHRTQVDLVMAGQMIDIKWRAIPDADDQYRTRRIASLEWQWASPEHWLAIMELAKPIRVGSHPGAGPAAAAAVVAKRAEQAAIGSRWEPVIWNGDIVYWNGDIVMHKVAI